MSSKGTPCGALTQSLRGFEFSRLDDARSGSALTVSLRLGHTRVLTAVQGCHSLPSCRFATSKAVIHYRACSNPVCKIKEGIRILAARRCSVRLGSDSHPRLSFTTEPVRIPLAKAKKDTDGVLFCFGAPRGIRTLDLPVRSRALYPLSYGRIFSSARIVYHNVLRLSIVKTKILKEKIFIFCATTIVIYNIFCYNTSVYLKR